MNIWLLFSGVFGFMAVAMGAVGAHLIGDHLSNENLQRFETAVQFQMWHALALAAVAWLAVRSEPQSSWSVRIAGCAFIVGTVLFSGSLYVLSLTEERSAAFLAPIGGVSLMVGWLAICANAFTRR